MILLFNLFSIYITLGWTGEKVVFAGDSAGANLILAVALRAQELNVQKPNGIVPIYGCFLVQYVPSPSRMMSLWDPLLAVGILTKILHGKIFILSN